MRKCLQILGRCSLVLGKCQRHSRLGRDHLKVGHFTEIYFQEVKDSQSNAVQWAELMAGHVGITELTAENLNLLVERIEVSDRTETGDGMYFR